jgi:hypothetical protein
MSWTLHIKHGATGVDAVSEEPKFKLFPNPVSEKLNIEWKGPISPTKLLVFDLAGRKVLFQKLENQSSSSERSQLDVRILTPGIYILQINSDFYVHSIPFIKK